MTLRTAIRRFLTQLAADGRSGLTLSVYRLELARFGKRAGLRTDVGRIRPPAIAAYLTSPEALVSPDGTKRSTRTVNRTRTVIRLLFSYLEGTDAIRKSPAALLRNARTDRPIPKVLNAEEEKHFIATLERMGKTAPIGRRDQVLFTLLLRSGMRLAAALALDVADVDLTTGVAVTAGKHGRIQQVFLPKTTAKLLKRFLRDQAVTAGAVFRGRGGTRLSPRQAQYRFRKVLAEAAIERPMTVHSLRHTFATRLQERTGDLRLVQQALGHRSLGTTEVYAGLTAGVLRAVLT